MFSYLMGSFMMATFRSTHVHKAPFFGKSGQSLARSSLYTQTTALHMLLKLVKTYVEALLPTLGVYSSYCWLKM